MDRFKKAISKWAVKDNIQEFHFCKVSLLEIYNLVKKLGKSQSFGHKGIDSDFLKLILPSVAEPLRHLINVSLSESEFANRWKIVRVFPLLKESDANRLDPASVRPVSLLPTISKVVEMAAQQQLRDFMESLGQLNRSGHAYRKFLSTTTTIAEIADNMYKATEDIMITQMMTVDQSAAFDCLSHEILARKLRIQTQYKGNQMDTELSVLQISVCDSGSSQLKYVCNGQGGAPGIGSGAPPVLHICQQTN